MKGWGPSGDGEGQRGRGCRTGVGWGVGGGEEKWGTQWEGRGRRGGRAGRLGGCGTGGWRDAPRWRSESGAGSKGQRGPAGFGRALVPRLRGRPRARRRGPQPPLATRPRESAARGVAGGVLHGTPTPRAFQVFAPGPASFSEVADRSPNRSRGPGSAQPTRRRGRSWGGGSQGPGRGLGASEGVPAATASHGAGATALKVVWLGARDDGSRGAHLLGTPEPRWGCVGANQGRPRTRGWRHVPAAPSTLGDVGVGVAPSFPLLRPSSQERLQGSDPPISYCFCVVSPLGGGGETRGPHGIEAGCL